MSQDEIESATLPAAGIFATLRAQVSRGDRVVYAIVAALIVLALLIQPLWGALQPGVALGHDFNERAPKRGPWGHPWVKEVQADLSYAPLRVWSVGPNGTDERGRGDDVVLVFGDAADLYGAAGEWVLLLAGLMAGLWELRRTLGSQLRVPRAPTPGPEVLRAAGLALVPGGALGIVAVAALRLVGYWDSDIVEALTDFLWVPPWVAAAGCAYLASVGFFLWVRLTRAPIE